MAVSDHCLGVDGLSGWVRMRGGTTLCITWGRGHACSWDSCHLCLLLPTSECGLKVDVYSFRQRQNLLQVEVIEQVVWGKRKNEKRPQSCLGLLPFVVSIL